MAKVYDPIMCMMVDQKTNDAVNGSAEYYYEMMKGKSKSEVEKIVMKAKGNPNAEKAYLMWKRNTNDTRTCDADPVFKNIYNSFASSINSSRKMDPKAANSYVGRIMKGCVDDLDKAFRTYNQEYNEVRERIMREGQKEMSDIFERYLKEGKK